MIAFLVGSQVYTFMKPHERAVRIDRITTIHPIIPGERLRIAFVLQVFENCPADVEFLLTNTDGTAVWSDAVRMGYWPVGPVATHMMSPNRPLPTHLPEAEYTLLINQLDRCEGYEYRHKTYIVPTRIP